MRPKLLLLAFLGAAIAGFLRYGSSGELPGTTPAVIGTKAVSVPDPAADSLTMEPVRHDLRDVTPASVHRPPPPAADMIARLPAVTRPEPGRPTEPDRWKRPSVIAPGILESQGTRIVVDGISPISIDRRCGKGAQSWPCGKFAMTAFQRLVRRRTITCAAAPESRETRQIVTRCEVSGHDLGEWLVRQGWATAHPDSAYSALETEARESRSGQWRPERR